jgi:hypothetical protein
MSKKEINKAEEPSEVYELNCKSESISEDLHPVLIQLLEKAKKDIKEGKGIPHEVVMKRFKEKFPFLK